MWLCPESQQDKACSFLTAILTHQLYIVIRNSWTTCPKQKLCLSGKLCTLLMKYNHTHILIASHNCEGLLPHIQDISHNQLLQNADIITLQETGTHQNMTIHSPLANHALILQHRQQQDNEQHSYNKGGVGLLIPQDSEYTVIDTSALQIECIAIKISAPPLTIVNIYRHPTYNLNAFGEEVLVLHN